jgi:hypothetical protein
MLRQVRPARGTCRVSLTINGTEYLARPLPTSRHAAQRVFRLRKADGATYHVSQHGHGAECDCPDFIFHRDGLDPTGCKHIKALAACGLIVPPELPPGWDDADHLETLTLADLDSDDLPFGPRPGLEGNRGASRGRA